MRRVALAALLVVPACGGSSSPAPAHGAPAWPVVKRFTFDGPRQSAPPVYLAEGQAWLGGECVGNVQKAAVALFAMGNHVVATPPILAARVPASGLGRFFEVNLGESYELTGSLLGAGRCTVIVRQSG